MAHDKTMQPRVTTKTRTMPSKLCSCAAKTTLLFAVSHMNLLEASFCRIIALVLIAYYDAAVPALMISECSSKTFSNPILHHFWLESPPFVQSATTTCQDLRAQTCELTQILVRMELWRRSGATGDPDTSSLKPDLYTRITGYAWGRSANRCGWTCMIERLSATSEWCGRLY